MVQSPSAVNGLVYDAAAVGRILGIKVECSDPVPKAEGGEILVTDVVRQLVAGKAFHFVDQGEIEMKGFEEPVRLFSVQWD